MRNIFQFITDNGFIDDEIYDFDDFLHILFDKESSATLNFACKTQTLVYFLENLSGLFSNMTRKEIEKSGRFITKQGEILTETNYGAAISRTKNKIMVELQKTEKFFLENFSQ